MLLGGAEGLNSYELPCIFGNAVRHPTTQTLIKCTAKSTFILTPPLVVKPSEDWTLIGRVEAGWHLHNTVLGEALRHQGLLKQPKGS